MNWSNVAGKCALYFPFRISRPDWWREHLKKKKIGIDCSDERPCDASESETSSKLTWRTWFPCRRWRGEWPARGIAASARTRPSTRRTRRKTTTGAEATICCCYWRKNTWWLMMTPWYIYSSIPAKIKWPDLIFFLNFQSEGIRDFNKWKALLNLKINNKKKKKGGELSRLFVN